MLFFQIENYDEFRKIFGTCRSSRGCIQNKILLAFWVWYFKNHRPEEPSGLASNLKNLPDLFEYIMDSLQEHSISDNRVVVKGFDGFEYCFSSKQFSTPPRGSIDFSNVKNIKYVDNNHTDRTGKGKLCSMGAGRFLRKIMAELGIRLPEQVITYVLEEFQRLWTSNVQKHVEKYKLVVDKHFDYIYTNNKLKEGASFGSCMTVGSSSSHTFEHFRFYEKSVDASAAYLVEDGKIVARCVIFHNVFSAQDGKLHNFAERQYSYNKNDILKTLLVNKLIDEGYVDLFKKVGAGAGDNTMIYDTNGNRLSNPKLGIMISIKNGDPISYLDSFKFFYPRKGVAYNVDLDESGEYNLGSTNNNYDGMDSATTQLITDTDEIIKKFVRH